MRGEHFLIGALVEGSRREPDDTGGGGAHRTSFILPYWETGSDRLAPSPTIQGHVTLCCQQRRVVAQTHACTDTLTHTIYTLLFCDTTELRDERGAASHSHVDTLDSSRTDECSRGKVEKRQKPRRRGACRIYQIY